MTKILSLCVAILLCAGPAIAQIRFENVSKAAKMEAMPRSTHPDPKIASARRDFENVYAPGYFWDVKDVNFADVNGDGNLDVFLLHERYSLWSRLWLGNGKGGFKEVPSAVEGIYFNVDELVGEQKFCMTVPYDFEGRGAQSLLLSGPGSGGGDVGGTGGRSRRLTLVVPKGGNGLPRFRPEGIWSAGRSIMLSDFDGDGCVDMVMGGISERRENSRNEAGRLVCGMRTGGEIEWGRTWVPVPAGGGDVAADFDNDGRPDVLCRGFWQTTRLLHNEGDRRFKDVTQESGLENLPSGGPVAVADFDRRGKLDIFAAGTVAGGKDGAYRLLRNMGGSHFTDVTADAGFGAANTVAKFKFGTAVAVDFDNDGWIDLVVCEGDRLRLYRNLGNMRFQDVTHASGIPETVAAESSIAVGDYDNDGRVDLLCVTKDRGVALLHNTTQNDNGWIKVKLVGPPGNPEGAGAQVTLFEPGKLGDANAIVGYQELIVCTDFRIARPLHFGLGSLKTCDVRVVFPGRKTVEQRGVESGKTAVVTYP